MFRRVCILQVCEAVAASTSAVAVEQHDRQNLGHDFSQLEQVRGESFSVLQGSLTLRICLR